ncbi:hypothetical protein BDM02DRAFT_3123241 [Thelephora ganbajun]|uniref:Uncharacterized protein n=1 Tax=Thelephora ganbajun TaxID=370292 RepID=A0ACB6Z1V5_THEGA|nr:hypothetical protein BDM02DRAFT_3123241 [Thelephora ganbajun]
MSPRATRPRRNWSSIHRTCRCLWKCLKTLHAHLGYITAVHFNTLSETFVTRLSPLYLLRYSLPEISRVGPGYDLIRLDDTSHHDEMPEIAFSSYGNDVIADVVWVWVTGGVGTPPGSRARYFANRVEKSRSFSPMLWCVGIHVIQRI